MSLFDDWAKEKLKKLPGELFSPGLASIAQLFSKLFGGGEPAYVEEFRGRFDAISLEFTAIHGALNKLALLIETTSTKQAQDQLIAGLKSALELSSEWKSEIGNADRAARYFEQIQFYRNYLCTNSYGHITLLAATLPLECHLAALSGLQGGTLAGICDQYIKFFEECKDPTIPRSLAGRLRSAEDLVRRLKQKYPDQKERVVEAFFTKSIPVGDSLNLESAHFSATGSLDRKKLPAFDLLGPHRGEYRGNPVGRRSPVLASRRHVTWSFVQRRCHTALTEMNGAWAPYRDAKLISIPALRAGLDGIEQILETANQVRQRVAKA